MERPLSLFKRLGREGRRPVFVLRKLGMVGGDGDWSGVSLDGDGDVEGEGEGKGGWLELDERGLMNRMKFFGKE